MIILLKVKKRLHNLKKEIKDLTPKYRSRVVKPKKGKVVTKEKNKYLFTEQ